MSISNREFREEFKPLHIPAHYLADDNDENKIVYALAQLGEGTADHVAERLINLDNSLDLKTYKTIAAQVLNNLFDKGLIKGSDKDGQIHYDLSKITEANSGGINPENLTPGLD